MAIKVKHQQPNADDLLKIVLTRSDLLALEEKCDIGELFDICHSCLARVHLHSTNMISTIGDILHEMRIQNVQFGKRLILTYLGFFELDQISEELPSSDELEAFLAKGNQKDQIPISRLTREFVADKWKNLIKILGTAWWRERIGYEIEEGELIEDDEEEEEGMGMGMGIMEMATNIKIENTTTEEVNNEEKENEGQDANEDDYNKKAKYTDIKKEVVETDFGTDFQNAKMIDVAFRHHSSTSSSGVETLDSPTPAEMDNESNSSSSNRRVGAEEDDGDFVQSMGQGEPIDDEIGLNTKTNGRGIGNEEEKRRKDEEQMEGSKQKEKEQEKMRAKANEEEAMKANEERGGIKPTETNQNDMEEEEKENEEEMLEATVETRPSATLGEIAMEIEDENEEKEKEVNQQKFGNTGKEQCYDILELDSDEDIQVIENECQKSAVEGESPKKTKEAKKTVRFMEPLIITQKPIRPIEKDKCQEEVEVITENEDWREMAKLVISYTSLENLHSLGGLDAEMAAAKGCWILFKMNGTQKPIIDAIVDISEESITFKHCMVMERRTLSDFMEGVTEKVFQKWKMDMKQWEEPMPALTYLQTKMHTFYNAFQKVSESQRKRDIRENLSRLIGTDANPPGEVWKIFVNTDQLRKLIKLGINKFQEIAPGLLIQCRINKVLFSFNPDEDWIMPITKVDFYDKIGKMNLDLLWAVQFHIPIIGSIRNPLVQYGESGWKTTKTTANSELMRKSLRKCAELGIQLPTSEMITRKHTELMNALKLADIVGKINPQTIMNNPQHQHYCPQQMATTSNVNYTPGVPMSYRPNWQRNQHGHAYKGIRQQQCSFPDEFSLEYQQNPLQRPYFFQSWPTCRQSKVPMNHYHPYQSPSTSGSSSFTSTPIKSEFPSPSSLHNSFPSPFTASNNNGTPTFECSSFGDTNNANAINFANANVIPHRNVKNDIINNTGNANKMEGRATSNNGNGSSSSRPLLDGNSFWNRIINPVQADP